MKLPAASREIYGMKGAPHSFRSDILMARLPCKPDREEIPD